MSDFYEEPTAEAVTPTDEKEADESNDDQVTNTEDLQTDDAETIDDESIAEEVPASQAKIDKIVKKRLKNERARNERLEVAMQGMQEQLSQVVGAITPPTEPITPSEISEPEQRQQLLEQDLRSIQGKLLTEAQQKAELEKAQRFQKNAYFINKDLGDYEEIVEETIAPLLGQNQTILTEALEFANGAEILYKAAKLCPEKLQKLVTLNGRKLTGEFALMAESLKKHDESVANKTPDVPPVSNVPHASARGGAVKLDKNEDYYDTSVQNYI